MISQGIPMFLMGDEYGHSRKGNNNPWCQDNDLNWFLWDKLDNDFFRFVKKMIHFRKKHRILHSKKFLSQKDILWYDENGDFIDWGRNGGFVSFVLDDLYIAFNAQEIPVSAKLPKRDWNRIVDTKLSSPHDFTDGDPISVKYYKLDSFSSIILKAK